MITCTVILQLRISEAYADPMKWDWDELLRTGDDFVVESVQIIPNKEPLE